MIAQTHRGREAGWVYFFTDGPCFYTKTGCVILLLTQNKKQGIWFIK